MEERDVPEEAGFEWEMAEDFQIDLHGKSEEDLTAQSFAYEEPKIINLA